MNINNLKIGKVQIIVVILLLIGLVVGVFLVQKQQIFKSKASEQIQNALEITPADPEKSVNYDGNAYQTDTLDVQIKLKDTELLTQ